MQKAIPSSHTGDPRNAFQPASRYRPLLLGQTVTEVLRSTIRLMQSFLLGNMLGVTGLNKGLIDVTRRDSQPGAGRHQCA